MVETIKFSYEELKLLSVNTLYTFPMLDWWLLKYDDLYKSLKINQEEMCEKCRASKKNNLPSDCLLSPEYCVKTKMGNIFIKHYENLDYFTQIYKHEKICMSAIEVYYKTPENNNSRQWLIDNYAIWKENVFDFGVFYLDNDDTVIELMKFYIPNFANADFPIIVERGNFKNIEEFLKIYYICFFEKRQYPEKLEFALD